MGFELHLALPSLSKEAVQIGFLEGKLVISGERKAPVAAEVKEGEQPQNAPRLRHFHPPLSPARYGQCNGY